MKRREFLKSVATSAVASVAAQPLHAFALIPDQAQSEPVEPDVKRVLMTFMCHLDIGFTDTQAKVMQMYFKQYYPQAILTAAGLREKSGNRYVWTTASWLLYEYLEQASTEERRQMEKSLAAGDLAWHAMPFNWQTEMLDSSMIDGCMGFSKALDARFGRKTTGGKMTDVPGHSRGLIPRLAAAHVSFLDVGVNPASTPPDVPDVFLWQNPDGASLAVLYHRHAYGSTVRVPGADLAISVNVRVDNTGPHAIDEINAIYADLRRRFPNAELIASSFTDVASALKPIHSILPVVTQEIGDTWIYGGASDPAKIASYREIARVRREWISAGKLPIGGEVDRQLLRRLALAPEHTWGTDTKRFIDHDHYSPKELAEYIDKANYQVMERSWREKRDDITAGVANLPAPLRAEAEIRLQSLRVIAPSYADMKPYNNGRAIHTEHYELMLDPDTGAIRSIVNRTSRRDWASQDRPLALFTYQTLTQEDYTSFLNAYVVSKDWWAPQDFGKPNIERFHPESRDWHPKLKQTWTSENAEQHRVLAELAIEDAIAEQRGLVAWPKQMFLELVFPKDRAEMQLMFYALDKAPNRMPEALWLTFNPQTGTEARWTLEKVDQDISPLDVVSGGARRMHAVTSRFAVKDGKHRLEITTLDAPVVALGTRSPLNFSRELPDLSQGTHVSLFNNAWGTNYPQWAGGDWRYRFTLAG